MLADVAIEGKSSTTLGVRACVRGCIVCSFDIRSCTHRLCKCSHYHSNALDGKQRAVGIAQCIHLAREALVSARGWDLGCDEPSGNFGVKR